MIRLCKFCIQEYTDEEKKQIIAMKQHVYCYHEYERLKLLSNVNYNISSHESKKNMHS